MTRSKFKEKALLKGTIKHTRDSSTYGLNCTCVTNKNFKELLIVSLVEIHLYQITAYKGMIESLWISFYITNCLTNMQTIFKDLLESNFCI